MAGISMVAEKDLDNRQAACLRCSNEGRHTQRAGVEATCRERSKGGNGLDISRPDRLNEILCLGH